MGGMGPVHDECTVIVMGMLKVAPWQPLDDEEDIEAALARSKSLVVFAGIDSGRSPGGTLKVTPVVLQSGWPESGVIVPSAEMLVSDTAKLFGFVTLKTTSPVPPGSRGEDGVPAVPTMTVVMVPMRAEPVPEP